MTDIEMMGILAIGLVLLFLFGIVFIIYKVIKTERERSRNIKNIKVGDSVSTPNNTNAIIQEIGTDYVIVSIKVPKSRVYPNK